MAVAVLAPSKRTSSNVAAECDAEVFETYDVLGNYLGTELRGICHAQGIWHRAVYCFVFNTAGQLLLQQRSAQKKISPKQWDLSVAEHLQPGETYRQAAARGLLEELGICAQPSTAPVAPAHQRQLVIPGVVHDAEFVESYSLVWDGPVEYNEEEVCAVKFVDLKELQQDMQANPAAYTEWFTSEIASLRWFATA